MYHFIGRQGKLFDKLEFAEANDRKGYRRIL
jgi:hypothetical protein